MAPNPRTFLFDNGSLRAASTLNLRRIAAALAGTIGPVEPVSLLHSSAVDPAALGGDPARLLEIAVIDSLTEEPTRPIVLLPLFFGPSAALTEYVPARMAAVRQRFPESVIQLAEPLCPIPGLAEPGVVAALAAVARRTMAARNLHRPPVILVDHGSPQPAVAEVRNALASALALVLADETLGVFPASMERREGAAYEFNEPLLATQLATPPCHHGDVLVLLQFLSPGRHAGPEGDIAEICQKAVEAQPGLRPHQAETIGLEAPIITVLAERWATALRVLRP